MNRREKSIETDLQSHEQRLALDVCKAKVDATCVAVRVTIAMNVLDLRVDAIDQASRKLLDSSMISL
jgi:hypothetical protein